MSLKVLPTGRQSRLSGETKDGNSANINKSQEVARKRQVDKDERIRKKVEHDLIRTNKPYRKRTLDRIPRTSGSVGILRPSPAITLLEAANVMDAARLMAVNRATAVLVVNEADRLIGIVTDKDLTYRVCAEGLNPNATALSEIMTRDPDCVKVSSNATEALNRMVSGGYRHLPIIDDSGDIMGLLDITECLFHALSRLEKAQASKKKLIDVLDDATTGMDYLNKADFSSMAEVIKEHLCFPKLSSIMDPSKSPSEVSIKTSVREAARIMKDCHQTAVLVVDDSNGKTVGIFTTKDIVTRIYGQSVEPTNTSTVRVMTPCPDMVSTDTTILQALRQMQDEHYQHLPLINSKKVVVGTVDILQLTYSTLNTLKSLNGEQAEDGPVWNKFWNAISPEEPRSEEPRSEESASEPPQNDTSLTTNSADPPNRARAPSTVITTPPLTENTFPSRKDFSSNKLEEGQFIYKCKHESFEQSHRFASNTKDFAELCKLVRSKMKISNDADIVVSYIDDESDKIVLNSSEDLVYALDFARAQKLPLVRLFIETKSDYINDTKRDDRRPSSSRSYNVTENAQQLSATENATAATIGILSIGVAIGVGVMWAAKSK